MRLVDNVVGNRCRSSIVSISKPPLLGQGVRIPVTV